MWITTLGTSHGDAVYDRFNSSTLYACGDQYYIVDTGEPVEALLVRGNIPYQKVKAIFITHAHTDHFNGFFSLMKSFIKYTPWEGQHVDIFLPEDMEGAIRAWMDALHFHLNPVRESVFTFHVTHEGEIYDDGVMKVRATRTRHMAWACKDESVPSYAYILEAEGKKVLHTGDLTGDFSDFPKIAQEERFDLCLTEATHYQPASAMPILETAKLDALLFIHVLDPWYGPLGHAKLLNHCKTLPYPVAIAHDGDRTLV